MKKEKEQVKMVKEWIMTLLQENKREMNFEEIHTFIFQKGMKNEYKELFNELPVLAVFTFDALFQLLKENQLYRLKKGTDTSKTFYTTISSIEKGTVEKEFISPLNEEETIEMMKTIQTHYALREISKTI